MNLKYLQTTVAEVRLETEGVTALVQWSLDLRPRYDDAENKLH